MYYLALSDNLSIRYVNNGDFFGVQKIDKTITIGKTSYLTSDESLNRSEYFHQKVITSSELTDFDSISLIAAYFPILMKNQTL
jgi:hypothetical protein